MNLRLLFTHGIRIIAVLAGLAVAGYGGQAALAKAGEVQRQVQRAAVVDTSRTELSVQNVTGSTATLSVGAPAVVKSDVVTETQSIDDKDSLTAGQDDGVAEPADDGAASQVEPSGDKASNESETVGDASSNALGASSSELESGNASNATGDFEIKGAVSAINGNFVTVNGMSITIASTTDVKGTLKVGDMVKVDGFRLADNTVQASEITIRSTPAGDQGSSLSTGDERSSSSSSSSGGDNLNSNRLANDTHESSISGSDDSSGHH